ncbi:hypothetical protein QL285_096773 [Trifolium repens]|nr:hypothetical protein QL285_096773 [Trifolium repens]
MSILRSSNVVPRKNFQIQTQLSERESLNSLPEKTSSITATSIKDINAEKELWKLAVRVEDIWKLAEAKTSQFTGQQIITFNS